MRGPSEQHGRQPLEHERRLRSEDRVEDDRHVVVEVRARGGGAGVIILDDGPGIPEAFRARICDRYVQVRTPGAPSAGGRGAGHQGLGLTFVRLAVQAHGGEVTVECPPPRGTVFQIDLPGAPPVAE